MKPVSALLRRADRTESEESSMYGHTARAKTKFHRHRFSPALDRDKEKINVKKK